MPWILDTDLLTILERRTQPAFGNLWARLSAHPPQVVYVTVVSLAEQMAGWLAGVRRARNPAGQLWAYHKLLVTHQRFCQSQVLPFDQAALDRFDALRQQRVRIGTQDLRIASITLATGFTLLSRNLRDFRQVPGLIVEDWTR